jgi:hypothetical protein
MATFRGKAMLPVTVVCTVLASRAPSRLRRSHMLPLKSGTGRFSYLSTAFKRAIPSAATSASPEILFGDHRGNVRASPFHFSTVIEFRQSVPFYPFHADQLPRPSCHVRAFQSLMLFWGTTKFRSNIHHVLVRSLPLTTLQAHAPFLLKLRTYYLTWLPRDLCWILIQYQIQWWQTVRFWPCSCDGYSWHRDITD